MKLVRGLLALAVGILAGLAVAVPAQAVEPEPTVTEVEAKNPKVVIHVAECDDPFNWVKVWIPRETVVFVETDVPGAEQLELTAEHNGWWWFWKHPEIAEKLYGKTVTVRATILGVVTELASGTFVDPHSEAFKESCKPDEEPSASPTTETTTVTETATVSPTATGQLAVTGADTTGVAAAGGGLVLAGAALLGFLHLSRRRRDAQAQE